MISYVNVRYRTWHTILYTICTYDIVHYGHVTSRVFTYIRYSIRYVFMLWYDIVCHTYDISCWHTISYKHTISYIQYRMSMKAILYIRYRIYDMVYAIQHWTYDIVHPDIRYRRWPTISYVARIQMTSDYYFFYCVTIMTLLFLLFLLLFWLFQGFAGASWLTGAGRHQFSSYAPRDDW
jgi:hypothetical protein